MVLELAIAKEWCGMVTQPAIIRFYRNLPIKPYCSDSKAYPKIRSKNDAAGYPYIIPNHPDFSRYLWLDVDYDYEEMLMLIDQNHVLMPTILVINPDSHRCHSVFELREPLPNRQKQSSQTRELVGLISYGYKELYCADKVVISQKQLMKNPLCTEWDVQTEDQIYTLREMADVLPKELRQRRLVKPADIRVKEFEETLVSYSRNESLFHNNRFYAYVIVRECDSESELHDKVISRLQDQNSKEILEYFPVELPDKELQDIASSISRWTWEHKLEIRRHRQGIMGFQPIAAEVGTPEHRQEVDRRRSLSASRTSAMLVEKTHARIVTAIEYCLKNGIEPTQTNLNGLPDEGRISWTTLRRHKKFYQEALELSRKQQLDIKLENRPTAPIGISRSNGTEPISDPCQDISMNESRHENYIHGNPVAWYDIRRNNRIRSARLLQAGVVFDRNHPKGIVADLDMAIKTEVLRLLKRHSRTNEKLVALSLRTDRDRVRTKTTLYATAKQVKRVLDSITGLKRSGQFYVIKDVKVLGKFYEGM